MWIKFFIVCVTLATTLATSPKTINCVNPFLLGLLKHKYKSKVVVQKITTTLAPPDCICVPYYQCDANNTIITDGFGLVDIRANYRPRRCTGDLEVCCKPPKQPPQPPPSATTQPPISPTTSFTFATTPPPTPMPTTNPTTPMTPGTSVTSSPSLAPILTTMQTKPTSPPTIPTSPPTIPTSPPTIPTSSPTIPTSPPTIPTSPSTMPTSPPTKPTSPSPASPLTTLRPTSSLTTTPPPSECICVPKYLCDADGYIITSGEGIINPRLTLLPCASADEVCCRPRNGDIRQTISLTTFRPGTTALSTLPTTPSTLSTTPSTLSTTPSTTTMRTTLPTTASTTMRTTLPITTTMLSTSIMTTTSSQPSANLCVCVLPSQCDSNGFVIVSGAGAIDPRFRELRQSVTTCTLPETCCKLPPNNQDSGVIFPDDPAAAIDPRANLTSEIRNAGTSNACRCIKSTSCPVGNEVKLEAAGIIDPRFRLCIPTDEVCCRLSGMYTTSVSTTTSSTTNSSRVVNRDQFPKKEDACGVPGPPCKPEECPIDEGLAYFAEFPWMVALLSRQTTGQALFMCGGSLIHPRAVLTATHCVLNRQSGAFVVRLGEYDTGRTNESLPFQEAEIQAIVTHPQYYNGGLYNDIAVLILQTPVTYAVNVVPICLPEQTTKFDPQTRCLASGWGKDGFDGTYQKVLQKIDLPILDRTECQDRLRQTRLGKYFQLHSSFMCAGGEESKDTCTGDGGGPLVCSTSTGQFIQVGIVSWGIGCGESNVPAVYVDVAQYRQWIDQQLSSYGLL